MQTPPLERSSYPPVIAPCEHIAGNEKFILKAFSLQECYRASNGKSLVDVTLDLEDGAPVGQEESLRQLFGTLIKHGSNTCKQVGVRIHPPSSEHCSRDIEVLVSLAGDQISYITIPKVRNTREIIWCAGLIRHYLQKTGVAKAIPLHLLIETPEALGALDALAALPEVATLDFGLMDFISEFGGAIPSSGMKSPEQFSNELLRQTKSRIALAALGANKVPVHNVTVDVRDPEQAFRDASQARRDFGFLRMWSIHPDQIEPIIRGMTPSSAEITEATAILSAAATANWGPIEFEGRLHDRASYRYYWGIVHRSGR